MPQKLTTMWLLTIAYYDPIDRHFAYGRRVAVAENAVDAFLAVIEQHEEAARKMDAEVKEKGFPPSYSQYEHAYANAKLVNAWQLTENQAQQALEEGW